MHIKTAFQPEESPWNIFIKNSSMDMSLFLCNLLKDSGSYQIFEKHIQAYQPKWPTTTTTTTT